MAGSAALHLPGLRGVADENWVDFYQTCQACQACCLAQTRTHVVVGRGALQAPLLILGEAPGEQEDHQGLPFVGRSGRLLELLLEEAGFEPQDYHIANIVKCRPPQNRVPTPAEIQACRAHLLRQFRMVSCRVVLTLGATAHRAFTGLQEPISRVRGSWLIYPKGDLEILPSFHPAFILRNNSQRNALWTDLLQVRIRLAQLGCLAPLKQIPPMPTGYERKKT